jgi:hypothetical protein
VATTYEHDDHGRVVRAITEPAWTGDDRALMLALQLYEDGLCSGCGRPKERAWHPDMDGWYEPTTYECNACSVVQDRRVAYHGVVDTRPPGDGLPDMAYAVSAPEQPDDDDDGGE